MRDGVPSTTYAPPACIRHFLTPDECALVIGDIDAAHQRRAEIWLGTEFGPDDASRSGAIAELPEASELLVQDRLWNVLADLEQHFAVEVTHLSPITALIYRRGDHFAAHSDGGVDDESPPEVRRRRVSLVVALNDGASDFDGGELHFFADRAPGGAARSEASVRIRSEPGMLVAFASPMVHQVTPVLDGRRYSLALWGLAAPHRP